LILALLVAVLVCPGAWGDRDRWRRDRSYRGHDSHFRLDLGFGLPWYSPWYFTSPYYGYGYAYPPAYYPYYPPAVTLLPAQPPVYVERRAAPAEPLPAGEYWYYCLDPAGYWPVVAQCPGGWQRVSPLPPATVGKE
jgi:hypothetical protein